MNQFLDQPTTNFQRVRDDRNSMPFYYDVDLTNARSISAGTALRLDIAANSFYSDADTTNGGNAVVHFQDTNLGNSSAPFFVSPGFIANVAFTQLLIENTAQPGKRMRIFYGVDIDFQAGVNSSIAIAGTVSVSSIPNERQSYGASYKSVTAMAANTPDTVFTPAANVNGAILTLANFMSHSGANMTLPAFIAKSSAPTTTIDGDVILSTDSANVITGNFICTGSLKTGIYIPAGKGLYYITNLLESALTHRSALYTLL